MSCAACSARVEKAVSGVAGVSTCTVNLLTNTMGVEGTATEEEIVAAVRAAGYDASKMGTEKGEGASGKEEDILADRETPILKKRLIWSIGFLILLMYVSMGHMIGLPLPQFLNENHIAQGLVQLLLSAAVMVINQKFFINGV